MWHWRRIAPWDQLRWRHAYRLMPSPTTALIQEQSLGIHYNQGADLLDYLADASVFEYQEGFVNLPTAPGLGIELDEDKVRRCFRSQSPLAQSTLAPSRWLDCRVVVKCIT